MVSPYDICKPDALCAGQTGLLDGAAALPRCSHQAHMLNVCERLCEEPFITLRACSNFTVASLSVRGMPHVALTNGHTLSLWRISSVNLQ